MANAPSGCASLQSTSTRRSPSLNCEIWATQGPGRRRTRSWATSRTTARPGELDNGWYFGHLDDFLSNEGAIFRRLPEISDMIRNEPVDIFIATDEAEYLYRVTGTQQLHRDELYLAESNNAQISLVTCWPFRVYDYRIVVSAVLIAVKPANEA